MTAAHWLHALGLSADLAGAFLIAREVLGGSRSRDLLHHLIRSLLWRSGASHAHVLADISAITHRGKGNIVRGTALLLMGFLLQLAGVVASGLLSRA